MRYDKYKHFRIDEKLQKALKKISKKNNETEGETLRRLIKESSNKE